MCIWSHKPRNAGSHIEREKAERETEIYYKELAHSVMETKSQDLPLPNWRPRRAGGIVSV